MAGWDEEAHKKSNSRILRTHTQSDAGASIYYQGYTGTVDYQGYIARVSAVNSFANFSNRFPVHTPPAPSKLGIVEHLQAAPVPPLAPWPVSRAVAQTRVHRVQGMTEPHQAVSAVASEPSTRPPSMRPPALAPGAYYGDYLKISTLLSAQQPLTDAHDEHLFITTHQVYELLFCQILYELNSVRRIFSTVPVQERDVGLATARLRRVVSLLTPAQSMLNVLETMSPLDFLCVLSGKKKWGHKSCTGTVHLTPHPPSLGLFVPRCTPRPGSSRCSFG